MILKKLNESSIYLKFKYRFEYLLRNKLKLSKIAFNSKGETSSKKDSIFKIWTHHCECVFVQRLCRSQQMFSLYSKWWEEKALQEFFKSFRKDVLHRGRNFLMGAVGMSAYNWSDNRIPDDDLRKHYDDLEYMATLRDNTVICRKCGDAADKPVVKSYDEWQLFIQQDDLIVWRRERSSGLFEYKVYGSYNDVTAEDFLNVQIDIDYRRQWDTTAEILEVRERELISNSDILYWEMRWPALFVNRDYVFNRRYVVDEDTRTIVVVSKTTDHPSYPKYPEKYRVEEYWSCMVIKPYTDIQNAGIEFSLTYFDNPGVNMPTYITNWVSKKMMPEYLTSLRNATKGYKDFCLKKGISKACDRIKEEERLKREEEEKEKLDYCSFQRMNTRKSDLLDNSREWSNRIPDRMDSNSTTTTINETGEGVDRTTVHHQTNVPHHNHQHSTTLAPPSVPATSTPLKKDTSSSNKNSRENVLKYLNPLYYFY